MIINTSLSFCGILILLLLPWSVFADEPFSRYQAYAEWLTQVSSSDRTFIIGQCRSNYYLAVFATVDKCLVVCIYDTDPKLKRHITDTQLLDRNGMPADVGVPERLSRDAKLSTPKIEVRGRWVFGTKYHLKKGVGESIRVLFDSQGPGDSRPQRVFDLTVPLGTD